MALLDIIINALKINCSAVQCTGYPSEIEAIFFLVVFPTVFLILVIYILTNFIFRGDGNTPRGLRLLIALTLYAFVIMQSLYTMFIPISRFWWLVIILLVGLWAFVRHLIHGQGFGGTSGKTGSSYKGIGGGRGWLNPRYLEKKTKEVIGAIDPADITSLEGYCNAVESQFVKLNSTIVQISNTSGEDKKGAFDAYRDADKDTEKAIQVVDDYLNENDQYKKMKHRTLNKSFRDLLEKYWERLKDMREEMGKVKKR
jgi:hypothetical protein